jgi:uncharacterized protein YtpQ (UPF0354 family)
MAKFAWLTSMFKPALADDPAFKDILQFRTFVFERLRSYYADFKDLKIDTDDAAKFSAKINGSEISGDLTNLFGYIQAYKDEDSIALTDRYIRSLAYDHSGTEEDIVAVVRTQEYVDYVNQQLQGVVSEPLVGELNVVYVYDGADSVAMIRPDQMKRMALPDFRKIGLSNLRKWLPKTRNDESIGPIALYYVEDNTLLTSGLILLDEFWAKVQTSKSSDVFFAVPRRDQLFVLDSQNADALPTLRKLIELTFQDGFNLLSNQVYRHREGKFEVVTN